MKIFRSQIRRIIREQLEGKTVELTSPDVTESAISAAWPSGVMYTGESVFDIFYQDKRPYEDAWSLLRSEGYGDGQEAYLGYSPSADVFVMGFDAWLDEGEHWNDWEDESLAGGGGGEEMDGVLVEMDPSGQANNIIEAAPGGMYPMGLKVVKHMYPDIINVRLD